MPKISALDYSLKLLGYRSRTVSELRKKLIEKGYDEPVIEPVIKRLVETNLINDEDYAQRYTNDKLIFNRRGPRRIYLELLSKGIDKDLIDKAVKKIEIEDEFEIARSLIVSKKRSWAKLDDNARFRRTISLLSRRGFSPKVIFQLAKEKGTESELSS